MKKRKIIQMLLYLPLIMVLLVSCTPKNEGELLIPVRTTTQISADNYTKPMTFERFNAFTSGKRSFILYAMGPTCSACKKLSPRLEYYVKKTKTEIYVLNTQSEDFQEHRTNYIEALSLTATPTIFLFDKGTIKSMTIGTSTFANNEAVLNFFGSNIKRGSLFIKDEKTKLPTKGKNALFEYNFNDPSAQLLFNEAFYPLLSDTNYKTYLSDSAQNNEDIKISFTNDKTTFIINKNSVNSEEAVTYFLNYFS